MPLARLLDRLDHGPGRWLVGAAHSARISARERQPVLVRPVGHLWVCRRPQHTLVTRDRVFYGRSGLRGFVQDYFLHTYRPRSGDTVVDLGGGLGEEVPELARLVGPTGAVHVFEAHPPTYGGLRLTVERNGLTNVSTYPMAVSDRSGPLRLVEPDDASRLGLMRSAAGRDLWVGATRLDEWMDEVGVSRIDFLKVNVEGAELAALQGLGARLADVGNVCVSCHDFQADEGRAGPEVRTHAGVRTLLESSGFEVTERLDDPRPVVQHYVYGARRADGPPG
jgi:FkbM family methyltransferase